jgi:hypothetical protein
MTPSGISCSLYRETEVEAPAVLGRDSGCEERVLMLKVLVDEVVERLRGRGMVKKGSFGGRPFVTEGVNAYCACQDHQKFLWQIGSLRRRPLCGQVAAYLQKRPFLTLLRDMGNIFSHSEQNDAASQPSNSLKRQPSTSSASIALKQTIIQNMRLSKGKISFLLKANHMNYSIVHRNHFYNTLPHVRSLFNASAV